MFEDGFPSRLRDDVAKVAEQILKITYRNVKFPISEQSIQYSVNGVVINFPYRIYITNITPDVLNKLSLQQQMIAHCIYSRSCNGFVRQEHLQSLLMMDYEDWAVPYIVKVCDEYVVEILDMTYNLIRLQDTEIIKKFCLENVQLFCKSYARMISYWNEFYRDRCYLFHKYIGKKLFKECFGYTRALERLK